MTTCLILILFLGVFPTFHSSMMFNQERIRKLHRSGMNETGFARFV